MNSTVVAANCFLFIECSPDCSVIGAKTQAVCASLGRVGYDLCGIGCFWSAWNGEAHAWMGSRMGRSGAGLAGPETGVAASRGKGAKVLGSQGGAWARARRGFARGRECP